MTFPADTVPDGSIWYAHHFVYFSIIAFTLAFTQWDDDRGKEPLGVIGGLLLSFFGWYHLWPMGSPITGALFCLIGLTIALSSVLLRPMWREEWSQRIRWIVFVCLLAASDDILEHSFGIWTPLDWLWEHYELYEIFVTVVPL